MSNFVEDGFEVVNVDNGKLEELRRSNNTLDCGAIKILESLDLFCDDLVDSCEYASQISYRNLFNSLRTVIKSAYENEKIRNAVMTGIIRDTPKNDISISQKKTVEKVVTKKKELNESEVREYSKNHVLSETARYFDVSVSQIRNYVMWHNIEYICERAGRKNSLNKEKVLEVSSELTIKELAALFNVKYVTMQKFVLRNDIPHKQRGGKN